MTDSEVRPRRGQRQEIVSKGDLRERALLDAASRLLAAGTFGEVSVAGIASEAGISRAAFYFYFASKQALLASLVDDAVKQFNERVTRNLESDSPADAVRSGVEAAAELWWDHRVVLSASVELGTAMPEVYERTMNNISVVGAPSIALLQEHGRVPEALDSEAAGALVKVLLLMSERSFFDLMRGTPTLAELHALTARLTTVWLRAFGLDD